MAEDIVLARKSAVDALAAQVAAIVPGGGGGGGAIVTIDQSGDVIVTTPPIQFGVDSLGDPYYSTTAIPDIEAHLFDVNTFTLYPVEEIS